MAYMSVMGRCLCCGNVFQFNAERVPSIRVRFVIGEAGKQKWKVDPNGDREPICHLCINRINEKRKARGEVPFAVLPGAYEPEEVA